MADDTRLRGLGLDGNDGHTRITKGDGYEIRGGSEETHERLQEVAIRVEEGLKRSGKDIREVGSNELGQRIEEAVEKVEG